MKHDRKCDGTKAMGSVPDMRGKNALTDIPGDRAENVPSVLPQVQTRERHQRPEFRHRNRRIQPLTRKAAHRIAFCERLFFLNGVLHAK